MNVMLSRAKAGLVIIGHRDTLQTSDMWSRWLDQAPVLESEDLNIKKHVVKKSNKQVSKQKKYEPNHKKRWKVIILWRTLLKLVLDLLFMFIISMLICRENKNFDLQ